MKTIKKIIYYILASLILLIESPMVLFSGIALVFDFISTCLLDVSIKLQDKVIIFNRKLKAKFAKYCITK